MKSYMLILTVTIFGAISMIAAEGPPPSGGKPGGKEGWMSKMGMINLTCMGEPIKKETMWKGFKECIKEMKGAAGDKKESDGDKKEGDSDKKEGGDKLKQWKEKMVCMQVCVMKKQGWLNADGDYNTAGADQAMKDGFPAKAYDTVKKAMDGCAAKIGDKAMANCGGYKEFMKCQLEEVMVKACENPNMMDMWGQKNKSDGNEKESTPAPKEDST